MEGERTRTSRVSRADAIRRKQIEIDDVERDMRGINPRLTYYRQLAEKLNLLEEDLRRLEQV